MTQTTVCCAGRTPALSYAGRYLSEAGITVSDTPVWNTDHLLLDVPSFPPGLWSDPELTTFFSSLPRSVTVWGGRLDHPLLEGFSKVDLLQDETYLQRNAAITAACTIPLAECHLKQPWTNTPVLIIGWGRIGKALARLLQGKGAFVTVATGDPEKQQEISCHGYLPVDYDGLQQHLPNFHLMINTAPAHTLTNLSMCRNCVKIDLASIKALPGEDILWARGLPGRFAPEQSGKLISETFLRLLQEVSP